MIPSEPPLAPDDPAELQGGIYRLPSGSPPVGLEDALARAGWATTRIDLRHARDKDAILDAFVTGVGFPDWFGHNWDALDDALRDLSWWAAGERGRVLLIGWAGDDGPAPAAHAASVLDILRTAVRDWATTTEPLVVVMHT